MKLYYAPGSCSLAPHITLREIDRRFDLERVDLATQRTASGRDYRLINPKGRVPALELDGTGSELLTEVPVLLLYLGDLAPERGLVAPAGTFARYHLEEALAFLASELQAPLERDLTASLDEALDHIERQLARHQHLLGEVLTVADLFLAAIVHAAAARGRALSAWPYLAANVRGVLARPAAEAALAAEGLRAPSRAPRAATAAAARR